MKCQGRCSECGECYGNVRLVTVKDWNNRNWGEYYYCENAIENDQSNKYFVYENGKMIVSNFLLAKRARILLESLEGCHVATLNGPLKEFIDELMIIDQNNQLKKL